MRGSLWPFVFFAGLLAVTACGGGTNISLVLTDESPDGSNPDPSAVTQQPSTSGTVAPANDSQQGAISGNTSQPPAEEKDYAVADITDLILITGQSNALGADTAFDAQLDIPHKRVFAFTDTGWQQADLHQIWDRDWFPRMHIGEDPSNNVGFHFAKQVVAKSPDSVVGIVLVTAPGAKIEHWAAGGEFYAELGSKVLDAINQLPHKSALDGIIWHQGESNAGDNSYGSKLANVMKQFREENWYAADRPFICGETAAYPVVNRQLMALNSDGDRWTGCVRSDSLRTQGDGFHFSAGGLRELGRRYAEKYLAIRR